jgi:hypothetical protein
MGRGAVRQVLSLADVGRGCTELELECGHVQRRRLQLCPPAHVICRECQGTGAHHSVRPTGVKLKEISNVT